MKYVLILFSFAGSLLLSSCGSLQYYMTQVSNKNNPSRATLSNTQNLPEPKCDHWCHNGWCSEHCDGDVNQNQY